METTTIKTTAGLESISNAMDDLIESLVFGEGKNGRYIKVLQALNKRLDYEISYLNS